MAVDGIDLLNLEQNCLDLPHVNYLLAVLTKKRDVLEQVRWHELSASSWSNLCIDCFAVIVPCDLVGHSVIIKLQLLPTSCSFYVNHLVHVSLYVDIQIGSSSLISLFREPWTFTITYPPLFLAWCLTVFSTVIIVLGLYGGTKWTAERVFSSSSS